MMTLAVMTRATLGHTGGALHAGPATTALYLLLGLSLVLRVIGSLVPEGGVLMTGSALFWGAAFLGFVGVYGPKLWRPRR